MEEQWICRPALREMKDERMDLAHRQGLDAHTGSSSKVGSATPRRAGTSGQQITGKLAF